MSHLDFLAANIDLKGCDVIDVGAGDGSFARQLHQRGAVVTGIEIDPVRIASVADGLPQGVSLVEGRGEDLPIESATRDLVCFIFSLHHVPGHFHDKALEEAERVLKPNGRLHVSEPLALGTMFDVVKFVEDETDVRNQTQARLGKVNAEDGFSLIAVHEYVLKRAFQDFDTFLKGIVFVDPERAFKLPAIRKEMQAAFHDNATVEKGRYQLYQPCVAYHFTKLAVR
jgi:SAM-dependent methyltransferase